MLRTLRDLTVRAHDLVDLRPRQLVVVLSLLPVLVKLGLHRDTEVICTSACRADLAHLLGGIAELMQLSALALGGCLSFGQLPAPSNGGFREGAELLEVAAARLSRLTRLTSLSFSASVLSYDHAEPFIHAVKQTDLSIDRATWAATGIVLPLCSATQLTALTSITLPTTCMQSRPHSDIVHLHRGIRQDSAALLAVPPHCSAPHQKRH